MGPDLEMGLWPMSVVKNEVSLEEGGSHCRTPGGLARGGPVDPETQGDGDSGGWSEGCWESGVPKTALEAPGAGWAGTGVPRPQSCRRVLLHFAMSLSLEKLPIWRTKLKKVTPVSPAVNVSPWNRGGAKALGSPETKRPG